MPGLQGYWALDETSGQRRDSSGRANHLADNNTVGSAAGRVGLAADLESDNQEYLSIGDAGQNGLDIRGSLTLVGWMNAERLDDWLVLAAKYDFGSSNNRAYRLDVRYADAVGLIVSPNGGLSSSGYVLEAHPASPLSVGRWYHVAGVYDATRRTMSVYLDGDLIGSRSVSYSTVYNSSAPFMLGANVQGSQVVQHFDGRLDDWRVYSRALSEGEIEGLMASSAPTPTVTPVSGP